MTTSTFPTGRSAHGERVHYLDADGRSLCGVTPNGVWLMVDPGAQLPLCADCEVRAGEGERTYSSMQVARAAGVSYRQVDYWIRAGHVPGRANTGVGYERRWTQRERDNVIFLAVLIRAGLTVAAAARLLEQHLIDGQTVFQLTDGVRLRIETGAAS
jgi:hypothetical protein